MTVPITAPAVDAMPEKRPYVQRLFTAIAPRYDAFNRIASLGLDQRWRRRVVAIGGVADRMRVLDVCTGTGDLALLCSRRTEARVIGLDFTDAMLRGAAKKSATRPLAWLRGDAQALPFSEASFERVFVGFSTRNLSDLKAGLAEMMRVLAPGGKLIILETGRPSNPILRLGYYLFLFTVAPVIGLLLTGRLWPFTYLARSTKSFLKPIEMVGLLNRCGGMAQYVPLSGGLASCYIAVRPGPTRI